MSDPAGGTVVAAPIPVSNSPAGQPAQQSPAIDPGEYQRLQRIEQQYNGNRKFYEAATKHGFKSPEDFDKHAPWIDTVKAFEKQGYSPEKLKQAFSVSEQNQPGGDGQDRIEDIEAMLDKKLSEREKDWVRKQAEKEHETSINNDYNELTAEKLAALLGPDTPDALKEVLGYAARGKYAETRKQYGEDSPLAGRFGPGGKEGIAAVHAWAKDIKTKLTAAQLAALGDAARKPSNQSTPAGNTGGGGAPEKDRKRDWKDAGREAAEAAVAARQAKR